MRQGVLIYDHDTEMCIRDRKKGAAVETGANRRPGIGQDFKGGGMQGADKRGAGADFSRGKQAFLRKEKFKWSNLTKFPKLV